MMQRFVLDPSRPFQVSPGWLALWQPRGRGRNDHAPGLVCTLAVCTKPSCSCGIARVAAIAVDDRAHWIQRDKKGGVKLQWHEPGAQQQGIYHLDLDFFAGELTNPRGGALPAYVAPFVREPFPAWVLDDIYAEWAAARPLPEDGWLENALTGWHPGDLLSLAAAYPERRPEEFVLEGRRYALDFAFCPKPGCPCVRRDAIAFEVTSDGDKQVWTERACAELEGSLEPRRVRGDSTLFSKLYDLWQRRSVHPAERLEEHRALVVDRGALLVERARERAPAPPPAQAPMVVQSAEPKHVAVSPERHPRLRCDCGAARACGPK